MEELQTKEDGAGGPVLVPRSFVVNASTTNHYNIFMTAKWHLLGPGPRNSGPRRNLGEGVYNCIRGHSNILTDYHPLINFYVIGSLAVCITNC